MKKNFDTVIINDPHDLPMVEEIAQWLEREAGFRVWLGHWRLLPGSDRLEAVEEALDDAGCCMVFAGSRELRDWLDPALQNMLENRVEEQSAHLIPVLLPGVPYIQRESKLPRFLRRLTWVEFPDHWREGDIGQFSVLTKDQGQAGAEVPLAGRCPFRGLEAFREQDRHFFFGREALVRRLTSYSRDHGFLAVLGPSGCGKSSVVQAGVIPELREKGVPLTLFCPRDRPLEELAFALRGLYTHEPPDTETILSRLRQGERSLHYIVREILQQPLIVNAPETAPDQARLTLIVDQFEETFASTKDETQRRHFIALLLHAVERGSISVVLSMRSDFLGKCAAYPDLNAYLNDHAVQIESMDEINLRAALEEPAQLAGLAFEKGLVDRIIKDIAGQPGELPFLGHALLALYQRRVGNKLVSRAYGEIGGIDGALAKYADEELARLSPREQGILRKIFTLCLIQPGEGTEDTRRLSTKEELLSVGGDPDLTQTVLTRWTNARLLTSHRDQERGQDLIDVAHEALIRKWGKIRIWMDEDRETARLLGGLRKAANDWRRQDRHPDYLLQGAPLTRIETLTPCQSGDLGALEQEFLRSSLRRVKVRSMARIAIAALFFATFAGLAYLAQSSRLKKMALADSQKIVKVRDFFVGMFTFDTPREDRGQNLKIRDALDAGVKKIDLEKDDPELQINLMTDTARAYMGLALYTEAETLLLDGLKKGEQIKGGHHQAQAEILYQLGVLYYHMEEDEKSEQYFRKALGMQEDLFGAESVITARTLNDLGEPLFEQYRDKEAIKTVRKALAIRRKKLGDQHIEVAQSLACLGRFLYQGRDFEAAKKMHEESLAIRRKLLSPDHPTITISMNCLALAETFLGNFEEAECLSQEALSIRQKYLGPDHPDVATIVNSMAYLYSDQGEYEKAESLFRDNLARYMITYDENHPQLATARESLACLLKKRGKYQEAEYLFQDALAFYRDHYGWDHRYAARTLTRLGDVMTLKNEAHQAEPLLREALDIYSKEYENHWLKAETESAMGGCLIQLKRYQEAAVMLEKAYQTLKAQKGSDYRETKKALDRLKSLEQQEKPKDHIIVSTNGQ